MAAPVASTAHTARSCTALDELCRTVHDSRTASRFPRRGAEIDELASGSHYRSRIMSASLNYDDTLIVPKLPPDEPLAPRARRVTTQFAPERRAVRWPWLIVAALWLAAFAQPIDPAREMRLSAHAQQVLRVAPSH